MANGFSVLESLNRNSKAAVDDSPKARFRTKDIPLVKIYPNERNFYEISGIEELANEIRLLGLVENLVVKYEPCEKGDYKIIGGERRYLALQRLNEEGVNGFDIVTCQIMELADEHQEEIALIIANSYRDKSVKDILEEESRLKSNLQYMKDNNIPVKGYDLNKGRLRDVIASMMHTSKTKIAQIESINKNLIPEFRKELEEGRLRFSAAYELAGSSTEKQQAIFEGYKETGSLTLKEAQQLKEEEAAPEEEQQIAGQYEIQDYPEVLPEGFEPDPDKIHSICYSCQHWNECDQKNSNVTSCNEYIDKAAAEKTEEQRYSEEQAKIDKQTEKILKERAGEEKMQQLPSESQKEEKSYTKRIGVSEWGDLHSGKRKFYVLKDEGQQENEKICFVEYNNGTTTGRTMEFLVEYVQREHSGIEEGYCILGIKNIND